jgi:zinc transport system ATP-binding protein
MERVVSVKNLSFTYNGTPVLENVNFDIFKGDYVGIVGPNGSGKSTLIKLILNILKPSKGSIQIFGQDINTFKEWGKIGYVAQKATSFNQGFPATVEEVISVNLFSRIGLFKPVKKEHMGKVYEVLEIVGIQDYGKNLIGHLSGGQQQKVFIARALVSSPEIIFLDEPTVGIDIESQKEFYDLLDRLNRSMNITIVIISHDIGVISERVNRIACVGDRKLMLHENGSGMCLQEMIEKFYGGQVKYLARRH